MHRGWYAPTTDVRVNQFEPFGFLRNIAATLGLGDGYEQTK